MEKDSEAMSKSYVVMSEILGSFKVLDVGMCIVISQHTMKTGLV